MGPEQQDGREPAWPSGQPAGAGSLSGHVPVAVTQWWGNRAWDSCLETNPLRGVEGVMVGCPLAANSLQRIAFPM